MKNTCLLFLLPAIMVTSSCSTQTKPGVASLSAEDSLKINSWNAFFGKGSADTAPTKSLIAVNRLYRPVPNTYTDACIARYKALYQNPKQTDLALIKDAFTISVEFNKDGNDAAGKGKPMHEWVNDIAQQNGFLGLSICFGIYVDPAPYTFDTNSVINNKIKAYLNTKVNRLTAFVRPSFQITTLPGGGDDFNLGDLKP